jgi:uncharacterized membrane-anchored protein
MTHGRVWKFRTAPVDPEDAMRGRYVLLSFAADEVPQAERLKPSEKAYAILKEGMDGFAMVDRLTTDRVSGDNVMEVGPGGWWDGKQHVTFPFSRYWVTEKLGPEADRAYAANSTRQKQNAYVTVRVRDGDAALEQLFIDGRPLKDYLREQAPSQPAR